MTTKITLTITILIFSLLSAMGQDTVSKMRQEISTAENVLYQIETSMKKDKHKEMKEQMHEFNNAVAKLEDQKVYLQSKHIAGMTIKIDDLKVTTAAFDKITHKSKLFDKDKKLKDEFQKMRTKLNSVKSYLDFVQNDNNSNQTNGNNQQNNNNQTNGNQGHQDGGHDNQGNNQSSVSSLKPKVSELKKHIHKVEEALKKSAFKDVVEHARDIQDVASKIAMSSDNSINTSANIVKEKAEEVERLAKAHKVDHHQIHEEFELIQSEFRKIKNRVE